MLFKYKGKLTLVMLDALSLALSGVIALYLRFEGSVSSPYLLTWGRYLLVGIPLFFVVYYYFGLYSRVWRYASARDLLHIAYAVTAATLSLAVIIYMNPDAILPRSILIIALFLNGAAVGGTRFFLRVASDLRNHTKPNGHRRALILGAGDAARIFLMEIEKHPELDLRIVGFLDDDPKKIGNRISGVHVLGSLSLLENVVQTQGVSEVIIAMPSAPSMRIRELVKRCSGVGVRPKTVPGLYSVLNGAYRSNTPIRDVQIEDLLPRPEIRPDIADISGYIGGRTVLVTGAGGSIGSELSRQIAHIGASRLLLLGHGENSIYEVHRELAREFPNTIIVPLIADVQDRRRIQHIFRAYQPQVVFHAAAHKHVPLMEYNPAEALKNNVIGTRNVAEAAADNGTERFVMISTDKAVNPTSVMGASKRIAELVIQCINRQCETKFMSVRFGNVLGSRGSVVPLFREQIARGGPITVTHPDITRYFMTIPEAVSLVIQAGSMGKGGEVFVLDMGEPVKIVDLARDLITLSGYKPDVDIRIEFTGLRPGEKMYEELLTAAEGIDATQHHRIYIAKQVPTGRIVLHDLLGKIELMIESGCNGQAVMDLVAVLDQSAASEVAAGRSMLDVANVLSHRPGKSEVC